MDTSSRTISKKKKTSKSNLKLRINPLSDARRVQFNHSDDNIDNNIEQRIDPKSSNNHGRKRPRQTEDKIITTKQQATISDSTPTKRSTLTKADLKARELWHKKSGAGYQLFVQYYASQPKGVVADIIVGDGAGAASNSNSTQTVPNINELKSIQQGKGQSRAAKKRRKKKMKGITLDTPTNKNQKSGENSICQNKMSELDNSVQDIAKNSVSTSNHTTKMSLELQHAMEQQQQQEVDCQHIKPYLIYLSQDLPLTFRIRQHQRRTKDEKKKLQNFQKTIAEKFHTLIQPVSYDPEQKVYQAVEGSGLAKSTLSQISPELKSLIVESTASGLIARQELGSMLPVLALHALDSLKYGSKVLDMCSSPGSKTLQALEIIASKPDSQENITKPGRLVANDIHPLRIESLKDAVSRSGLPQSLTDRIVYTNHDATTFPTPKSGKLFDCIIADVPCSGDGTIRKDRKILAGWMPSIGNSLHSVQKKILIRAMRLVKIGGVVAYSTCSLNPIEDEAVVASALSYINNRKNDDGNDKSFEILDWPSHLLPKFKRSKGVSKWNVADFSEVLEIGTQGDDVETAADEIAKLNWFDSFDDAKEANMVHAVPSMWPPSSSLVNNIGLSRCVRLRPQSHDSGGFFVALLRRLK